MSKTEAIRQTVNSASITEQDLWEAKHEIVAELDGDTPGFDSVASILSMSPEHPAISLELLGMLLDMQADIKQNELADRERLELVAEPWDI
jgi:hypothetical protein